ncbi:MAG TPA: TonB-dependent receptor [bacterium]|nr:TonB-dependent receptor [bacterium]
MFVRHARLLLCSFLAAAIPTLMAVRAPAQEVPSGPPTFQLPEIEVAGKRPQLASTTPASVSVITADEIAAMGALTVADALRVLPEVLVKGTGGSGALTTVSIRGETSTRVLVLLDGVPLNRPDQPSVDLSTLPIQNVERIEVLRGPFSAIYGSSALGGVINIVTRTEPQTSLSSRVGSFGESANVVSTGGTLGNLTYLVQGIVSGSTGFAPDTDYSNSTEMAKLHWAIGDDAGWTLTVNRFWHVVGTPGPLPQDTQDLDARTFEGRTLVDLAWRSGKVDGPGTLVRFYTLDDDVSFLSPHLGGTTNPLAFPYQSDDVAHLWGGQAQIVLAPLPGHLLTLGADYQGQTISHTDNTPSAFGNSDTDLGLYLQDDWQVGPRVLLSAGVREDVFQLYGTQVDPRAGLVFLLNDRLALRVAAGRTFRAPSFDELAPSLSGNPNLQPETAWSYDAGLEYAVAQGLTLTVTGYYTDATNLIVSAPPNYVPMNVGHALVSGGSIELAGQVSDQWFVRANYTSQYARDANTGLDVVYAPRNLANLEVTYAATPATRINLIVSYVGDRWNDPANTELVPGYWLTAIVISQTLGGGFTVQAGVANLFDVQYQASLGYLEPGRTFFIRATKSF